MPKLTKRLVDATSPGTGQTFVWDDELSGFGLRVLPPSAKHPSGVKSYILQYRTGGRGSQQRRLVIGRPGVFTPDEARERARRMLALVADGHDPALQRDERRTAINVGELAELYLREGPAAKPNKRLSSWKTDRSNIERHIKPLLGRKVVRDLEQLDIAKFQADVAAGKSKADVRTGRPRGRAIISGGPGTAARTLAVLSAMLQFAVERHLITANPARFVELMKPKYRKERFLSEVEVARLADIVAAMESEGSLSRNGAAAIRLLMLTGCRKLEILSLRWEWVDFEGKRLNLPTSKTGQKTVPLASPALAVLAGLPRSSSAFALPAGKGSGHYTGLQKDWARVRERAGLSKVRIHDLRHSFASFAVASGHSLYIIGKTLGHKQARTTEGYAHLANDPVLAVAEHTGTKISNAMTKKSSL